MSEPIVSVAEPVTLVGGADIASVDLNISLKLAPVLVAADGGANRLLALGQVPRAVIGDMDSLSDAAAEAFTDRLHRIEEQETTDFEKALTRIAAPFVIALGFAGARLDHTLAVLNVMARQKLARVILLGPDDIAFRLPATVQLDLPLGTRLSLMPMGTAHAHSHGLRWELDGPLSPDGQTSPSNEVAGASVNLRTEGPVLAILPRDHLDLVTDVVRG